MTHDTSRQSGSIQRLVGKCAAVPSRTREVRHAVHVRAEPGRTWMDTLRSCSVATAFPNLLRALTLRVLPLLPLLLHDGALAGEQPADAGSSKGSVGEPALRKLDDVLASTNSSRITDVTLFDGEKVIEQATVVVRGGWISKVCEGGDPQCAAPELSTVEGVGKFLMPSMIDAEGHFSRPTEGLDELPEHDRPVCGTGPENQGKTLRVSTFELMSAFAEKGLFTEVDTHGLRLENGIRPHRLGERYPIPPSANYEKHIRFGVTTVLDMAAYPWPANYVRRSRNQWKAAKDAEAADLRREFLIYADFYGSGMWAAPAGLQVAFYGLDPGYNVKPDGPWDRAQVRGWVASVRPETVSRDAFCTASKGGMAVPAGPNRAALDTVPAGTTGWKPRRRPRQNRG